MDEQEEEEYSGGIGEPKQHHKIFIVACGGVKGCFLFVPLLDPHKMVGIA